MIIKKLSLPRRTFLRGLGATLSLPLLDAMVPALSALKQTAATPPVRLGFVFVPNGLILRDFLPETEGPGFKMPRLLAPLGAYQEQLTIVSGLANAAGDALDASSGPHSRGSGCWLNGMRARRTEGSDIQAGTTIDQFAAKQLGKETPLASLELGLEGANFAGSCDSGGFSCAFSYTISWRDSATPLPMEHNPRAVFERLFGDNESTDPAAREARRQEQRSILDSVSADVARLQGSLGPSDRLKLGAYLAAVRDVERRIEVAEAQGDREVPLMARPMGVPASFAEHAGLMYDLQLLAHQTDRTRVTTFMSGHELSGRTYPEIDVPDAHHPLSHHRGVGASLEKLTKINTYHLNLFASFVEKLRSTPDGDGSLLDHMILMYGAGMSDSNSHSPYNLPILLLGGGAGHLNGGRHVAYAERDQTPLANLHVSLLDKLGAPVEQIGDSTGPLRGLSHGMGAERLTGI